MEAPGYFKQHMEDDDKRFSEIYGDTQEIKGDIKVIKENHLAHIQVALEKNTTDTEWIKWLVMTLVAAVITLCVSLLIFYIKKQ